MTNAALNDQMERFWKINEGPITHHRSIEEQKCEKISVETCKRASDVRFEVDILMREDCKKLGDSRINAEKRLLAMERRFAKDPTMKERYHQNLEDFLEQGHMTLHSDQTPTGKNYLPHHAVLKESSTTTKLRVVWDASCKISTGISLNDCLMTGPVVQQELFLIIIRFRQHRFVMTGDIVKMYRQIWFKPEQRDLQCILWRKDPNQAMMTYQLKTVTFGVTSSPYLATRCLVQLAEQCKESHPGASQVIRNDFYVDDVMTGADTETEINTITEEVTTILQGAGFELQKIHTNKIKHDDDVEGLDITEIKTLGLRWQPGMDVLRYQSSYELEKGVLTKRVILSAIAQVFDPLGLIGPFVMRSKLLLQHLWKLKIGWDAPVPLDVSKKWIEHCDQLRSIGCIKIPRHALAAAPEKVQIHGFCDASQVAYGACIYLRSSNADGSVLVRLLTARSRVSPIKTVSLPRLELCGALLLANLYAKIKDCLTIKVEAAVFWSDSTVALAWIRGDPSR
ncbi:uncharacterized protein LOC127284849 [Leptopilina boulardi]|uniref:uncharacterized protein LOC127284849 n=1 Tax=Leptopilina boulardi TaxID=63433 RepID=UPI0021F5C000|nr:uncharacterized protein LOC127284849 [Leptopilina boulardi]